jgi:MFS family permease
VFLFCAATGLTLGTYLAVDQALMVAVLPDADTAARDLGVLGIGSTLPGVIAPVVGGTLINTVGYTALFLVSLVLAVAAAAVITLIRSVR